MHIAPTPPSSRSPQRARMAGVGALVVTAALAGCGSSHHPAAGAPAPTGPALALSQLAAATSDSNFSAVYTAVTHSGLRAKVTVYVQSSSRYRIDVTEGTATASLYGTAQGSIACTRAAKVAPVCYLVAAAGQPIPSQYDAGVQHVFTTDLPALASQTGDFTVTQSPALPAAGKLPAAQCFGVAAGTVSGAPIVDVGTYCLAASGPPRQLAFASGTLSLASAGAPPTASDLTPPAKARVLPSASSSASH